MGDELNLARDLAVILISAGIFTIISKALKQPLILGYIVAGFLIGPNVNFFLGISSTEAVHQWSEIGMVFLMFGLGLEFSFKKLLKVGSGALITAGSKFLGVFVLGFIVAQAMSWTVMESIFLGGLLSMSSTTVIIKSFDEMGLKKKPYAQMVFGTIIIEDLIAILLMVLLSSLAVSNRFAGKEMLFNLGKLAFFLILWFLTGIYVIPTLLKKAKKYLNNEILLIVSIGLCFGMVALAEAVGFSSALGAFVMGSILAETIEGEHIEHVVNPIKDLFGAVFFVSVGMMVAPTVIAQNWLTILIITLLVFVADIIFVSTGVVLAGKGLENAVHTGFSLAQLGEFGFIIAGVGCSLGVMRDFIYPVIIAVSVITTFTTPYMIRLAGPAYSLIRKRMPEKWLSRIDQAEQVSQRSTAEQSEWKKLIKAYLLRIVLYGVIILAVDLGTKYYLSPFIVKLFPNMTGGMHSALSLTATLLLMAPFIYGLAVSSGSINTYAVKLLKEKKSNRWPIFGLVLARTFIAIGIVLSVISSRVNLAGWAAIAIVLAGVVLIFFARHYLRRFNVMEDHFMSNFNEKEKMMKLKTPVTSSVKDKLGGYDVHIEAITVPQESSFAGQRLKNLPFREDSGANIIKIQRGAVSITIPSGDMELFPLDRLLAVGTEEQLSALREMVAGSAETGGDTLPDKAFDVVNISLGADSYLTGQTLRNTRMRDYHCMVISVMRDSEFITNPKPDFCFAEGDTVWIAGETDSCEWLK